MIVRAAPGGNYDVYSRVLGRHMTRFIPGNPMIIPLNMPGLMLWSRPPFNRAGLKEFDQPLTWRFDESDCMLVFTDVKVPWEKVIVHDNPALSRKSLP